MGTQFSKKNRDCIPIFDQSLRDSPVLFYGTFLNLPTHNNRNTNHVDKLAKAAKDGKVLFHKVEDNGGIKYKAHPQDKINEKADDGFVAMTECLQSQDPGGCEANEEPLDPSLICATPGAVSAAGMSFVAPTTISASTVATVSRTSTTIIEFAASAATVTLRGRHVLATA